MVVWGKKETDPSLPFCGVQGLAPLDQKAVDGYREGLRTETPKGPLGQMAVAGEVHRGGFGVLEEYQGRVHQHQKEASGGKRGGKM